MIDLLLSSLAPHLCYSCGDIGALLCDNCKYNIVNEELAACILCARSQSRSGICSECQSAFSKGWCVGERTDELRLLIDDYKFQRVRAAYIVLAELLFLKMGTLPQECVIVSIPSNPVHIRQRGYDHAYLIAQHLAKLNHRKPERLLARRSRSVQTGKSRQERITQAALAFAVTGDCKDKIILIVDDIITTGATVEAAGQLLKNAGAADVWVAVLARQPLD